MIDYSMYESDDATVIKSLIESVSLNNRTTRDAILKDSLLRAIRYYTTPDDFTKILKEFDNE